VDTNLLDKETDVTNYPLSKKIARSKKQMIYFAIASLVMMFAD
jgi:cytochrome c oxidase subunit 3